MSGRRPIVQVQGVSFSYSPDGPEVLRDIQWSFPAAAVTALLGPNGSGKTTLLNVILGWLKPRKGVVRLDGEDEGETAPGRRGRRIGLVPQDEALAFELELLEYVLLGRAPFLGFLDRPGEEDRLAAAAAIEAMGLTQLSARPVNALSAGERQLAAIARALAQDPAILLLDEPLSHLDLSNTRRLLHVLLSLRRAGKTIILTTHDPNIAAVLADEAVLLKEGRVLAGGPAAEVMTAAHLAETYGVPVDVRMIDGRPVILPQL